MLGLLSPRSAEADNG